MMVSLQLRFHPTTVVSFRPQFRGEIRSAPPRAFSREIESFRRDHPHELQRKRVQRFVERLRRIGADFRNLQS